MLSAIGRATAQQVRVGAVRHASRLTAQLTAPRAALVVPTGIRVAAVFSRGYAESAAAKTTTAAGKKKPAAKKAAKPKSKTSSRGKGRPKKTLTEEEQLKKNIREWKKTALLKEEPERLPSSAYVVYLAQRFQEFKSKNEAGREAFAGNSRRVADEFKALSPTEVEKYEAIAQQNKVANDVALKNFVESRTPQEIREANLARYRLRAKLGKSKAIIPLEDPRFPSRPMSPYIAFFKSRVHLPEFEGQQAPQRMVAIAEQFKNLSVEERKPFEEIAATDKARYEKERAAYEQFKEQK